MKDICERIDLYIVEGNRKDDFEKWVKVVNSCKTVEQLDVAVKMGENYYDKYGDGFWKDDGPWSELVDKMRDITKHKRDKLTHQEKVKMLDDIKKEPRNKMDSFEYM